MEWVLHPLLGEMDWQLHGTNPPGPRKKRKRPSMSSRFDACLLIPSFPSYYTLELHPNLFPFVVLAGQCVRYACVVRLYASCTLAVVVHFTELTVGFFFCMKTYKRWLVCFLNFVILSFWLIGYLIDLVSSNSTCINTCNKKSDSRSAVDRFCLSHVKLQTELSSTQSYHQFSIFFILRIIYTEWNRDKVKVKLCWAKVQRNPHGGFTLNQKRYCTYCHGRLTYLYWFVCLS